MPLWRITLTAAVINAAAEVAFIVSGAAKADVLRRVLEGPRQAMTLPAQAIEPSSGLQRWYVDAAAAANLETTAVPRSRETTDTAVGGDRT
jgi:6-phosphogluconolactonase